MTTTTPRPHARTATDAARVIGELRAAHARQAAALAGEERRARARLVRWLPAAPGGPGGLRRA